MTFRRRHRVLRRLASAVLLLCAASRLARGTSLLVPDEAPSIQAAIDAGVDSVLIRPGSYPETPVVARPRVLVMGADSSAAPTVAGLRIYIYRSNLYPALYAFQGLRLSGPVVYYNNHNSADISFASCYLQGGMVDTTAGHADTDAITFTACPLVLFGLINCSQGTSCVPKSIPKKTSAVPLQTGRKAIQRRNQPKGRQCSWIGGAERSSRASASSLRHCESRIPEASSS